jgi:DNA gyrase subunit A
MVGDHDEVLVVMEKGKIVRSRVSDVRATGRDTSGVRFATPDRGDSIIGIARNAEHAVEEEVDEVVGQADGESTAGPTSSGSTADSDSPDSPSATDGVPSDGAGSDDTGSNDAAGTEGAGADEGSAEPGGDE